jgi:hypothetical protein
MSRQQAGRPTAKLRQYIDIYYCTSQDADIDYEILHDSLTWEAHHVAEQFLPAEELLQEQDI